MRICSVSTGVVLLAILAAACKEKPRLPVPDHEVPSTVQRPDAGSDREPAGGSSGGEAAGSGGSKPPSYMGTGSDHVSESCSDFSTGAVHARANNNALGGVLMDITPNRKRTLCGSFPFELSAPDWQRPYTLIRQTDGKLFYLRNGDIFEFVHDASSEDPYANDIKVSVAHACPANPDPQLGPFSSFFIKPHGGFVYACVGDKQRRMYDEDRTIIEIDERAPEVIAADDDGNLLMFSRVRGQPMGIWDHGFPRDPTPIGPDAECFQDSLVVAARALSRGFLLALENRCGVQLWRMVDTSLMIVDYYVHAPNTSYTVDLPKAELAADGVLYYSQLCNTNITCFECGAPICGIMPGNRTATAHAFAAVPPANGLPDGVKAADFVLFNTW